MSTTDPQRISDGFSFLRRGVNSGSAPDVLSRENLAFACNATMRGGKPHNRPGINRNQLSFDSTEIQNYFEGSRWQGAGTYTWRSSEGKDNALLICSIGGHIYTIDAATMEVSDISLTDDPNPAFLPQVWIEQAEMFSIIQDGQSGALIFDGAGLRRADPIPGQVPVGTMMAYAMGRLTVVLPDGRSFVVGNIVGGRGEKSGGTAAYQYRDSILSFTENQSLVTGGVFSGNQRITALREIASVDRQVTADPLFVFTPKGGNLANFPTVREQWETTQYPLVTGGLRSKGPVAHNSTIQINSDIWYRAVDKTIRSLRVAQRDYSSWGDTPMSKEVNRILKFESVHLLKYGSAVLFDNRMLMSCLPTYVPDRGVVFDGLISLDFDEPSSLQREGNPAYDGLWTGIRVLQILTLEVEDQERCFCFGLDGDSRIGLWEISLNNPHDNWQTSADVQRIPWFIETPRYNWGEYDPRTKRMKKLVGGEMHISELNGLVNFYVRYRPDSDIKYRDWYAWSECADQKCIESLCDLPNQAQYRDKIPFPSPGDTTKNTQTDRPSVIGYTFQARIDVLGCAQIESFALHANNKPEASLDRCRTEEPCKELQACNTTAVNHQVT